MELNLYEPAHSLCSQPEYIRNMPGIETILSPALFDQFDIKKKVVVMIDVLRASSTIISALDVGLSSVIPVAELDEARKMKEKGFTIAAERQGRPVEGFDLGNSPIKIREAGLEGKELVLTTTNGTKCLKMSTAAEQILVGAVLNIDALSAYLNYCGRDVVLFCAAWKDRVNWEDSYCAGGIVDRLCKEGFDLIDDASSMVRSIYLQDRDQLEERLQEAVHFKRLSKFGVGDDILYSFSSEDFPVIPVLKNGKLVDLTKDHETHL